ncbi:APC family permease [Burkholderia glumae]|uniref:APC family permease n=1 Tax=Burkholderia glumae TaxID=337 RepID=UPI001295610D|nr:APC family permease [Burkholderia glumae]MCM2551205.1 APC family permease [Burkholderia glumae]NVE25862.1 APC family permease [Burkholderia glumae]QGA39868.1 amino acid permease [Burkholderia glumae]
MNDTSPRSETGLSKNAVGLPHIVFFVVAAAAPLTAMVGATPAAFSLGNGPGVPGVFVLAGVMYLIFSIGYAAMSRHISNAGAFYAYIANGLGRPAGVGGAFIAIVAYNAVQVAIYCMFGFFLTDSIQRHYGVDVPWWAFALACVVAVHVCGARRIEFSGRLLGTLMIGEIAIVMLLDLAIVAHGAGAGGGFSARPFSPAMVFAPGLGTAPVFVLGSYMGFEATAIFSEEARDPKRTIPRATYLAVILIMAFYALSSWAIVETWGERAIAAQAARDPANLWFAVSGRLLGGIATDAMNVLLVTSLFAAILSFHNTITRYFYAMGRERVLWRRLGHTCPVHRCPDVAGKAQTLIALAAIGGSAAFRLDPFTVVFSWMSALATIGIIAVQILVAASVIAFFARDHRDAGLVHRLIAPLFSMIALGACLVLVVRNLSVLSGSDSALVAMFPYFLAAVGALGVRAALRLKRSDPDLYRELGRPAR